MSLYDIPIHVTTMAPLTKPVFEVGADGTPHDTGRREDVLCTFVEGFGILVHPDRLALFEEAVRSGKIPAGAD